MKKYLLAITVLVCTIPFLGANGGCERQPTSDDIQAAQQEKLLSEGTKQVGMPAIKNFRERKILKDILEMRDQEGLVTYAYLENVIPVVIPGHTCLGGKLTYYGQAVGYGLPYATQFTNPSKIEASAHEVGYAILPQADPNGLFSPSSAEGTWLLMKDPNSDKVLPDYVEPKVIVKPFRLPMDTEQDIPRGQRPGRSIGAEQPLAAQ
jgi:hypothetical protein